MKNSKYYNQCGNCTYSSYYKTVGKYMKIWCSYYRTEYYASDSCNHYKGAYVTTAVCDILGRHEYNDILAKIRELRNEVMEKDSDYDKLLDRYDRVGPVIAGRILDNYKKDKDNSLAQNLFNYYIEPTVKMYEEKDYLGAIEKYSTMEDVLEDCFGLKKVDYTNVGETRLIKHKKEVNK